MPTRPKINSILIFIFLLLTQMCLSPYAYAQNKPLVQVKTVVIDPGHGGRHPGAVNGKIYEKDITLPVGLRLGRLIKKEYPHIKVLYTRTSDQFVALDERTKLANKNNADLFISIHANSTKSQSAKGSETFVMGQDMTESNIEVCQLENSVITLEDDYSSKYSGFDPKNPESYIIFSLLQNSHLEQSLIFASLVQEEFKGGCIKHDRGVKQAPFLVLWQCTMPSVLVELGFMSNPSDLKQLSSKSGQAEMAKSIFDAFVKYEKQYETTIETPNPPPAIVQEKGHFKIQVMVISKLLPKNSPEFKGIECEYTQQGKLYKYTYGEFQTKKEAQESLPLIRKKFPESYIIGSSNN